MPFLVNPVLTGIASAVKVSGAVIDSSAVPSIEVGLSSFKYRRYNSGDIMRDHSDKTARKGGSYAKVIDFGGEELPANTSRHSLDVFVDNEDNEMYASPQAHMESKTRLLAQSFKLTREKRLAAVLLDAGNYAAAHNVTLTGTNKWSDAASTPFKDIDDAIDAITLATGFRPNKMIIGREAATTLKNHADYIDRFKGWKDTVTTSGLVPNIAGLDIVDAHAVVNTANEGAATATSAIFDNVVIIMFVNTEAATLESPSFFYRVYKYDTRVREMADDRADGTFVEEDTHEVFLPICDTAGYILRSVV